MKIQCPQGHVRSFSQYAIGIYSCNDCDPIGARKFNHNAGLPYWTDKPETRMVICNSAASSVTEVAAPVE